MHMRFAILSIVAASFVLCSTLRAHACPEQWLQTRQSDAPFARAFRGPSGAYNGYAIESRERSTYYAVLAQGAASLPVCPSAHPCIVGRTPVNETAFAFVRVLVHEHLPDLAEPDTTFGDLLLNPQVHLTDDESMDDGLVALTHVHTTTVELAPDRQLRTFARGGAVLVDGENGGLVGLAMSTSPSNRLFARASYLKASLDKILR